MYVPILTYGHKFGVATKRMRFQMQVFFFGKVTGLTFKKRVMSSDIWRESRVELLLPHVKESVGVIWASYQDVSWEPPFEIF